MPKAKEDRVPPALAAARSVNIPIDGEQMWTVNKARGYCASNTERRRSDETNYGQGKG
jgi:hypothetical protein